MALTPKDPKPSYEGAITEAIQDWHYEVGAAKGCDLSPNEMRDLAGRIMRKVRDKGIVIGLEDGTDYARRT